MAVPSTYYLNGTSLADSTAVFTDSELTILADDGWYSDGEISRQQLSGVLLPQQNCPTCGVPCGSSISVSGSQGIYLVNLDAGSTSEDIGAVIIRFDPYSVPDGIRAIYNGVTYNKLSSPVDGLHQSTNAIDYTFIGEASSDCGISGTTYPALTEYIYDGGSFISTGNTQSVTVAPGDVSFSVAPPSQCVMVIPKEIAEPNIINIEVVGPCSGTGWGMSVSCPAFLDLMPSSEVKVDTLTACTAFINQEYFLVKVSAGTTVDVYDFVFFDPYGATPLDDGYYKVDTTTVIKVENGIVIEKITCSA